MNKIAILLIVQISYIFGAKGQTTALRIGDLAPSLKDIYWIKNDTIPEFKKGMIYVVEMGATWCKPCIAAFPALSDLAKRYDGSLEVIGVFVKEKDSDDAGYLSRINRFVERQGDRMLFNVAAENAGKNIERNWIDAFGASNGIPQTFVVDKNGRLAAHVEGSNISMLERIIDDILNDQFDLEGAVRLERRRQTVYSEYDPQELLLVNGNGGNAGDFLFRSIVAKSNGSIRDSHSEYLPSTGWLKTPSNQKIIVDFMNKDWDAFLREKLEEASIYQTVNATVADLYQRAYSDTLGYNQPYSPYQLPPIKGYYPDPDVYPNLKDAYGKLWRYPIVEVNDSSAIFERYDYSLKIPPNKASAKFLQECMRQDLDRYFNYDVVVESRTFPCYYLICQDGAKEKLSTLTPGAKRHGLSASTDSTDVYVFSNRKISEFVSELNRLSKDSIPIIDNTGIYKGEIDYILTSSQFADLRSKDFDRYKQMLEVALGLFLEKGEKSMNVVVIRDPDQNCPIN